MKSLYLVTLFAILAVGCGKCDQKTVYVPGTTTPAPVADAIQSLVDEENTYRLSQGQTILSPGLSCTVQLVSAGAWLSSSSPGYNAGQGVVTLTGTNYSFLNLWGFNQPDSAGNEVNNILPKSIQSVFVNQNYKINCTGFIVVEQDGYHQFDVSSDDGSILTVDGTQLVNNDGNHGITTKSGTKLIRRGVKSFSLAYAQTGSGNFALILNMDQWLASGVLFYH